MSRSSYKHHECDKTYCRTCKKDVTLPHQWCFISTFRENMKFRNKKFTTCFFDIESVINDESGIHEPNLIVWSFEDCDDMEQKIGTNCIENFMTEITTRQEMEEHRNEYLCLIAHNLRAYDGIFILKWFFQQKLNPSLLIRNQQILQISYTPLKIIFRDSINWIAMPLNNFVKSFGLNIKTKKYFPLLLNSQENLEKTFPAGWFPDLEYFLPDGNNVKNRSAVNTH